MNVKCLLLKDSESLESLKKECMLLLAPFYNLIPFDGWLVSNIIFWFPISVNEKTRNLPITHLIRFFDI